MTPPFPNGRVGPLQAACDLLLAPSADQRMTLARATIACGSARSRQIGQLHAFFLSKNQLCFGATKLPPDCDERPPLSVIFEISNVLEAES